MQNNNDKNFIRIEKKNFKIKDGNSSWATFTYVTDFEACVFNMSNKKKLFCNDISTEFDIPSLETAAKNVDKKLLEWKGFSGKETPKSFLNLYMQKLKKYSQSVPGHIKNTYDLLKYMCPVITTNNFSIMSEKRNKEDIKNFIYSVNKTLFDFYIKGIKLKSSITKNKKYDRIINDANNYLLRGITNNKLNKFYLKTGGKLSSKKKIYHYIKKTKKNTMKNAMKNAMKN